MSEPARPDAVLARERELCAEVAERWHELVRSIPPERRGLDRLRALRLTGGAQVVGVLRPHILGAAGYRRLRQAANVVSDALAVARDALLAEPERLAELGFSAAERELITIDHHGPPAAIATDRLDAFVSDTGFGFLEVQGAPPTGIAYSDEATAAMLETAAYAAISDEYELEPQFIDEALIDSLLESWRDWGGVREPAVAIVDWRDVLTHTEFDLVLHKLLTAGLDARIVDPRSLRFDGRRLRSGGFEIDLVYRRLLLADCARRADQVAPLLDAVRAGAVCCADPFSSNAIASKAVFALLTDPAEGLALSAEQREVIARHVPWTRRVAAGETTAPDGEAVDLLEYLRTAREQLVLKPANDYGGHGVLLGSELGEAEWERGIAAGLKVPHVAQLRMPARHEQFPIDDTEASLRRFSVDSDPFTFRGRAHGLWTRLGVGDITNITAGGSMTPNFLLAA